MLTPVIAVGPTKSRFVRLRLPELQNWSGAVHVTGLSADPAEGLFVAVCSDPGFDPTIELHIEESADGVDWAETSRSILRTDIAATHPGCRPPVRRSDDRAGPEEE